MPGMDASRVSDAGGGKWSTSFELLQRAAEGASGRGIYVRDRRGTQQFRTLSQLLSSAHRAAFALRNRGVESGDRVLIAQPTGFDFLTAFFGLQALGAVPVPLGWPDGGEDPFEGVRRLARWRRLAQRYDARVLICGDLGGRSPTGWTGIWPPHPLELVIDVGGLLDGVSARKRVDPVGVDAGSVAYVQSTSGTTGPPRGVELTHCGIRASVEAIGDRIGVVDDDVIVSWLPLDNIMGLVGVIFFALHWNVRAVLMHPGAFLEQPEDWFWTIADHGATLSLAPNFAFNYCVRRCNSSKLEGLDLSSWRIALNGSEPVRAQHIQAFARRFHQYGLGDHVIAPVYGLSETTLGVTVHPVGEPPHIDGINRRTLECDGRAEPLPDDGVDDPRERMHVVSVGKPLEGLEVRIVDGDGEPVGERILGEIAICGPNVMAGYVESTIRDDALSPTKMNNDWLLTGDLGYVADGELYFVGRDSDRIALESGRSVFPEEVELFVDAVDGVRAGSTAVFEVPGKGEHSDEESDPVVVAFEVQAGAYAEELMEVIRDVLRTHFDLHPRRLVDLPVRSIPKTPTGKVRRHHCRALYAAGVLGQQRSPLFDPERLSKTVDDVGETLRGSGESIVERLREYVDFDG